MGLITTALNAMPPPLRRKAIIGLEKHLRKRRQSEIEQIVRKATGNTVYSGPFVGMLFPDDIGWPRYYIAPMLLGTYESQLAPAVERIIGRAPQTVVVAGSAEGYFVAGMARRLPGVPLTAFDILEHCRTDTAKLAELNGGSVDVLGACTVSSLRDNLPAGAALVMDVEGAELELLNTDGNPMLKSADILVECHDRDLITPRLVERFSQSHGVTVIEESERPSVPHPALATLNSVQRSMAVCEYRGAAMQWLHLEAKDRQLG